MQREYTTTFLGITTDDIKVRPMISNQSQLNSL
jgi:hypothetical protein